jgi:hypothetical protein
MAIDKQSEDIAAGVWVEHEQEDIGAGDQACRAAIRPEAHFLSQTSGCRR